jgi:hypothetical protein
MTQYIFSVTHWLNVETFEVDRVWWLRFNVNTITSHPSHRRILKDNAKFEVRYEPYTEISLDDLVLYERYRQHIQFDTYDSLAGCLYGEEENKNLFNSWSIGVYDDGVLIAKGIIDLGHKAIMAKVNFYHPVYAKYSLGKFLMLKSLDFMRGIILGTSLLADQVSITNYSSANPLLNTTNRNRQPGSLIMMTSSCRKKYQLKKEGSSMMYTLGFLGKHPFTYTAATNVYGWLYSFRTTCKVCKVQLQPLSIQCILPIRVSHLLHLLAYQKSR